MSQAREMAHLTKDLAHASEFRLAAVDAIREARKSLLATCADMRGEMVRDYRVQTQKFLSALSRDVAGHRKAMAHQVAQTQKFLGAKAKDVAAHRNATMNQIARFGGARRKAASRLRSSLQHQVDAIVTQSAQLRNAAADAVSEVAKAHRKMAKQQKAALKSGHRKLHADTSKFVNAIHADRMKAHEIWSGLKFGSPA
ncbi:MAG: hypothetical protein WAW96_20565 [Alphaproteobacteria bacterium]